MYKLYDRGALDFKILKMYFGLEPTDLKNITGCAYYSSRPKIMEPNLIGFLLDNSLRKSLILKKAFYATAELCNLNAQQTSLWSYSANDKSDKTSVIALLLQETRGPYAKVFASRLCFPIQNESASRIKDVQKRFLARFNKNLDELVIKSKS